MASQKSNKIVSKKGRCPKYKRVKTDIRNIMRSLALLLVATWLVACHPEEAVLPDEPQDVPIAFASRLSEEQVQTRADAPLERDFTVYGYKSVAGEVQTVFQGYKVQYASGSAGTSADNTHNYGYVGVSNGGQAQTIKFWDFSASEYHFWACTDAEKFSADGTLVSLPVALSTEEPTSGPLYSAQYERKPVGSDVVQLSFLCPYAKVRVMFFSGEPLDDDVTLGNIVFTPDAAAPSPQVSKVYAQGTLNVQYYKACAAPGEHPRETLSLTDLSGEQDNLPFSSATLTPSTGTSADQAVTALPKDATNPEYVVLPMGAGNLNPAFTLTLNVGDETKSSTVPAAYMQWLPGHRYIYIFKIGKVDHNVQFYDVTIDPWVYGGKQTETFTKW